MKGYAALLSIFCQFALLLTACGQRPEAGGFATSTLPVTSTVTAIVTSAPTRLPSPTPLPPAEIAFHVLRIEFVLTSDWGTLDIAGLQDALSMTIIEKTGTPNVYFNTTQIAMDRPVTAISGEPEVRLVIDVTLPVESGGTLTFVSKHGGIPGSLVRLYLLPVDGEPLLLKDFNHQWTDPNNPDTSEARFTVELSFLAAATPHVKTVQRTGVERLVWAVYYPWYMENFFPRWWTSDMWTDRPLEPYSSDDVEGMRAHIAAARSAGIDGFLVEWCGIRYKDDADIIDANFGKMLDLALEMDFKLAAYYDLLCTGGLVDEDLEYLLTIRATHPAYYRMNGLPVVVMFSTGAVESENWPGILDGFRARGMDAVYVGESNDPAQFVLFDGLHQYVNFYEPDLRSQNLTMYQGSLLQSLAFPGRPRFWAATVSPGFDNTPIYNARDALNPGMTEADITILDRAGSRTYRDAWEAALQSGVEWIIITSWNEWQENTHIEPSQLFGTQYLDLTSEYIGRWK